MYVPLKITTDYSLLKSTIKIENLISFLSDMHITAAAIVDENLFGIMEFYNSCIKNSIKPIIGLELTYKEQQIYCYAKNYQGYQNLLKLHTIKETREVTPADFDLYHHELKIILPFFVSVLPLLNLGNLSLYNTTAYSVAPTIFIFAFNTDAE